MPKRIALLATAAALAVMPALAQQSTTPDTKPAPQAQPSPSTQPSQAGKTQASQQPGQMTKTFVDAQSSDQWLGSTLIGLSVKGSGDESIGSINDLLVDKDGNVLAAVIGVGGFLGIGAKNVAVSFDSLNISRKADGKEEARLVLTKAELEKAPAFKAYEPPRPAASRPGGDSPGMAKKPGSGM